MLEPDLEVESDGTHSWYLDGQYHRLDGPAVIQPDGTKHWFQLGLHHRAHGPAVEYADGLQLWYLNGHQYTLEEYCLRLYGSDWAEHQLMLAIRYSS